jgi:PPOX class probable F420-dependent enzyme
MQPDGTRLSERQTRFFRGKNFGHLATVMPDGSPQVSPVWIDEADGLILVNSAEGRVKTENVRRDPRVAISVHDAKNPYRMVTVRGTVVEVTHEGAEDHIDALARKYTGAERYRWHDRKHPRVIIKIQPNSISGMGR